jgi:hypothetical protein
VVGIVLVGEGACIIGGRMRCDALDASAEGVDERVVVVSSNGWWVLVNGDDFLSRSPELDFWEVVGIVLVGEGACIIGGRMRCDALDESAEGVDERVVVVSSNGWWVLVNGDVF